MADRLTGPSVLALVGDASGSSLWRVLQPITALEQRGYPCGWDRFDAAGLGPVAAGASVLILTRLSWPLARRPEATLWFDLARARGQVVIYELDDDLVSTAYIARGLRVEAEDGKTLTHLHAERQATAWVMAQSDGVTVSTPHLAEVVRGFTDRPVIVVPNAIDVSWFRSVLRVARRHHQAVTIGWAGGRRDELDLAPMAAAWSAIAGRHPSVRFVVAGHRSPALLSAVPADRLTFRPWLPIERYPVQLAGLDIGCAAVAETAFNAAKSNIKAQEYALAGAAVIASPLVYGDLVEHGRTGLLATTADEWTDALERLVSRPAERAIMAGRLRKHVERRWSLRENLVRWPAAWSAIAADARARRGQLVVGRGPAYHGASGDASSMA